MVMASTPIGCAFLSNPDSLTSGGVASIAGGEPFTFTSMETLAARGAVWVVSCRDTLFLTDDGGNYPFLRHNRFLATPVNHLAQELGSGDQESAAAGVQRVSEVLTRVVAMAGLLDADVARLVGVATKATLVSVIQSVVAPALRHEDMPKELLEAMPSLFKAPAAISAPNSQDIAVRLPANRLRLAQAVLGSAVPAGTWTEVDLSTFPNPASALSWAIGNRQPAICNIVIRGSAPRAKATAPLLRNLTAGAIRWMALPEVIAMSRLVDMVPKRIFVASEYVPSQASLKVPPPAFSPSAPASISAGLLAEAYLHAACATSPMPLHDDVGDGPNSQLYSIRAAWLTAVARSYMLQEALALAEANISVMSFNTSHVMVGVSKHNLRMLRKTVAASQLLSYPTWMRTYEDRVTTAQSEAAAAAANEGWA
jgi:hypothetical protein